MTAPSLAVRAAAVPLIIAIARQMQAAPAEPAAQAATALADHLRQMPAADRRLAAQAVVEMAMDAARRPNQEPRQ